MGITCFIAILTTIIGLYLSLLLGKIYSDLSAPDDPDPE